MQKLIIGDITSLYYSIIHYYNKESNETDNFKKYKNKFDEWLQSMIDDTKATEYLLYDDDSTTFRHKLFPDFKANRKSIYLKFRYDLMKYAREKWGIKQHLGIESDDLVNIAVNKYKNAIICHIDSDLDQIEGNHYNYLYRGKGWANGFYTIDKSTAEFNLNKMVISTGHNGPDKGLPNCGDKTAEAYLKASNDLLGAFINGIDKKDYPDIWRTVKGYGITIGVNEFYRNFLIAKLLDTEEEANYWLDKFGFNLLNEDLFIPTTIKKQINGAENW